MSRRIVKVLAVLLVLLCMLPVVTGAVTYRVGDTLWTAGEKPTADTEMYSRWIPVIRPDNVQEHREVGQTGTYEYQWIVEEYYGPGEKKGIPTSFSVKNVDSQGNPMVGTEFILFEERGNNLLLIASAVTNAEGVAHLDNLCLDDNSDTAVWHLVQTNFPESKMAKTHHPYTGMWDIYVSRDSSGEHTLEMAPSPAAQTMTLGMDDLEAGDDRQVVDFSEASGKKAVEENYDETEHILTVVNEAITGRLSVYVSFEDGVVPESVKTFSVVITPPNGSKQTVRLTTQYPETTLIKLPLGDYTIEEQTAKIQAEGYNLKTKYTVERVGEDPVESQTVTIDEEHTAATVTVTNIYEEVNIANTIVAKVMDEKGTLLDGARVQLLDENDNVIPTDGASGEKGVFVFDDLADYAVKGKTTTFKIVQSEAPSGYKKCEDQYIISVEKKNGKVTVSAKRDAGFFARLFRSGESVGSNGETVIEFKNEADLGNLSIKINNKGEACPADKIKVSVTGLNHRSEYELSAENSWQVTLTDLPKSQYTIRQNAAADGYDLQETYSASGGILTGNQVQMTRGDTEVTITNAYSLQTGKLQLQMAFAENIIPATVKEIPVTVTGEAYYADKKLEQTVNVTAGRNWQAELELPLGEYHVAQTVVKADGYELIPDPQQSKKVSLTEKGQQMTCTFTNPYSEIKEQLPEKIIVQMTDLNGNPIAGGTVGLFLDGEKLPKSFPATDKNGQIVIDDLKSLMDNYGSVLPEGETKITLEQIGVPAEYKLAKTVYDIVVQKNGEEISYSVPSADINAERILVTFVNDAAGTEELIIPGKIVIEAKDENGAAIAGITVGLYMDGEKLPKSFPATDSNGQIVIDDLQSLMERYGAMLPEGETKIVLQQITVPEGYEQTADVYNIEVQNNVKTGEISYTVPGADITSERILLTFTNNTAGSDELIIPGKVVIEAKDGAGAAIPGVTVGLFMDGEKLPKSFPATDSNGQIVIDDLQSLMDRYGAMLPEGETRITLQQITVPEGYEPTTQVYNIVVQNNAGEISYTVPGADITSERILVSFTNRVIATETGSVRINVGFLDKPATADITKVTVSFRNPQGVLVKSQDVTEAGGWTATVSNLPVGEYTVSQGAIKLNGYTVSSSCSPQKVTVTANGTAECNITNQFKQSTTSSNTGSSTSTKLENQIGIRTLDTSGAPLAGAKYGLFHGATAIRSYTDYGTGQINIDTLEKLLGNYAEGEGFKQIEGSLLTLQQTQAPLGGKRSTTTYDVYISYVDGELKVNVKGSEIDANGVQLVDFVHAAKEDESQPTQPTINNNTEDKKPGVIVIRTVDEAGNVLPGAEYCLSTDLRFDKDEDIVYSKADRHGEITLDDLEEHVEKGKKATYYLLQSRQPEGGNLSAERFVVELSRKKKDLAIEVRKDAGILERMQSAVEETTTGEWVVTFCSTAKTSTIHIDYEEVVDWHDCLEAEDVLQQYKKNEYEFQLNWEFAGEKKEPLVLKLSKGEGGSFEPIPYGAKYEIVPVQDGCYHLEFTKGELKGVASQTNLDLKAKVTYNIDKDAPMVLEMLKLDSRTEKPLAGVEYILKNGDKDEVDVYKTDGSGKMYIDAITEPGEYTLTEREVPEGYNTLKKDIGISVSVAFKEVEDEQGNPMILQTLEAVVNHSQVRKRADGIYRIGTSQASEGSKLPIILAGAGSAVALAAGAGVAVMHNKKKKFFKK